MMMNKTNLVIKNKELNLSEEGFTLIELLIATVIFSIVLLIAAAAIIYVSKTYIKGQVEAQTQLTAQDILNTVAQDIEYNSTNNTLITAQGNGNPYYYCIGNHIYVYRLNKVLSATGSGNDPTTNYSSNVLQIYNNPSSTCPKTYAPNPSSSLSKELLSAHERLGALAITPITSSTTSPITSYAVSVVVAYGNNQVLHNNLSSSGSNGGSIYSYQCIQQSLGGNFCAVSSLTTIVTPRIN